MWRFTWLYPVVNFCSGGWLFILLVFFLLPLLFMFPPHIHKVLWTILPFSWFLFSLTDDVKDLTRGGQVVGGLCQICAPGGPHFSELEHALVEGLRQQLTKLYLTPQYHSQESRTFIVLIRPQTRSIQGLATLLDPPLDLQNITY